MMNWYTTRDDCNLVHRGQALPPKVKLWLTEEQANLHNTERQQVVKCEAPALESEVGVLADWIDFETLNSKPVERERTAKKSKISE